MAIIDSVSIGNETRDIYDSGAARKVTSATNGHLAGLDANGNLTDSGVASSRQTPASGGTALSLVNTGDMYTWNNKVDSVWLETHGTPYTTHVFQMLGRTDAGVQENYSIKRTMYQVKTVVLSTSAKVSVTITEYSDYLNSNSIIEVFAGRAGGDVSGAKNRFPYDSVFTEQLDEEYNRCTVTFPISDEVITLTVRIYYST